MSVAEPFVPHPDEPDTALDERRGAERDDTQDTLSTDVNEHGTAGPGQG